jgi:hypothetical protein
LASKMVPTSLEELLRRSSVKRPLIKHLFWWINSFYMRWCIVSLFFKFNGMTSFFILVLIISLWGMTW